MRSKMKEIQTARGLVSIMRDGGRSPMYRVTYRYQFERWRELVPFTHDGRRALSAFVRQVRQMDG